MKALKTGYLSETDTKDLTLSSGQFMTMMRSILEQDVPFKDKFVAVKQLIKQHSKY